MQPQVICVPGRTTFHETTGSTGLGYFVVAVHKVVGAWTSRRVLANLGEGKSQHEEVTKGIRIRDRSFREVDPTRKGWQFIRATMRLITKSSKVPREIASTIISSVRSYGSLPAVSNRILSFPHPRDILESMWFVSGDYENNIALQSPNDSLQLGI